MTMPLSEMLLFSWLDARRGGHGAAGKPKGAGNKPKDAVNKPRRSVGGDATIDALAKLHAEVVATIGAQAAMSGSMNRLLQLADNAVGSFAGGFGRYRAAKLQDDSLNVSGVLMAASNYENTQSILELIVGRPHLPTINIRFDGEESPLTKLRIEAFLEQLS